MKLIYLHQYFKFPNETGGTRSYDLAKSFITKGYNVNVISATSDSAYKSGNRWTKVVKDDIVVYYIYLPYGNHLSYLKRINIFIKFLFFSSFKLCKMKADLTLATSTPLTIGIPVLINKWVNKKPYIFEVRDVWPEAVIAIGAIKNKLLQKILFGLERIIYKNAEAIVPLSIDMQSSIIKRFPEFKEKTSIVIENIAEISRFRTAERIVLRDLIGVEPRFSVLYAGTFGKVNGIYKVVELASKTLELDSSLIYILIGSGAEKDVVVKLAKSVGVLNKNVFILDPISKKELPKWYNSISMGASFVIDIPELWANSANKFFDTLASQKPVLINYEGWQARTIRSNNVGYVLPFEITDEVAKDFVDYSKEEVLILEQERNAIKLANEKYSLKVSTDKYLGIFSKVLRKNV